MSLVDLIDRAVDYVRWQPSRLDDVDAIHRQVMTCDEMAEFRELVDAIYAEAFRAGLLSALPQVHELRPQLESAELPPPQFESKLNLPGDWTVVPDNDDSMPLPLWQDGDGLKAVGERIFLVCVSPRWIQDMVALRALADVPVPLKSSATESHDETAFPPGEAVWLGNRQIQIGRDAPLTLPEQYATVLECLVESRSADSEQLERSGGGPKKLREMLKKFPQLKQFVILPGGKGKGGYRTTIRDGRESR
jgi:hypothetical protein